MKRKLTLTIELENAAFDDGDNGAPEAARVLADLAGRISLDGWTHAGVETEYGATCGLWDVNGNWCGSWRVILDQALDFEPMRWADLSPGELEALRTALHNRIYKLSEGGRELDPVQQKERQYLCNLQRELNIETGRRLGS